MRGVTIVQMPLLNEGTEVWRPVSCRSLGGALFVVDAQPTPETEQWMFPPGRVIRCEPRRFSAGEVLLAAASAVPEEPETVGEWLELHDSVLRTPDSQRDGAELQLDGFIHRWETRAGMRFGLGFIRPVAFRFSRVGRVVARPAESVGISNGFLAASGEVHQNLLPLPLDATGGVLLSLALCDGTTFEIAASDCFLSAIGEGRFVQTLAEELDPMPA
jgi:hypothetical protein